MMRSAKDILVMKRPQGGNISELPGYLDYKLDHIASLAHARAGINVSASRP